MYFGEESRCFFLFLPTLYSFKQFFCTSWSIRNIFIWQFRRCYDIFYWKLWKNRLKIHCKSKNICFILWQFSGYPIDHRMKLTFKVSNFSFTIFCPSFIVLFCKMWIEASNVKMSGVLNARSIYNFSVSASILASFLCRYLFCSNILCFACFFLN